MEINTISSLVQDQNVFDCRGYSILTVSQRAKDVDGNLCTIKKQIRLPIRSAGVIEFQEQIAAQAPRPPITHEIHKAGSKEATALGVKEDVKVIIFDTTDETYCTELDKHNREFVWRVAIYAIDVQWVNKDCSKATTYEEKKNILRSNGITGVHLDQITKDVYDLARFQEVREDFLSKN